MTAEAEGPVLHKDEKAASITPCVLWGWQRDHDWVDRVRKFGGDHLSARLFT